MSDDELRIKDECTNDGLAPYRDSRDIIVNKNHYISGTGLALSANYEAGAIGELRIKDECTN
jgi:hypothetical protein